MIRRRLVAVILAVVAAVTGGAGVLIVVTMEHRLIADVDQELATQATAVAPHGGFGRRPPPGPSPGQPDEGSPFDVRRYAFVSRGAAGNVEATVASGRGGDPRPPPRRAHGAPP